MAARISLAAKGALQGIMPQGTGRVKDRGNLRHIRIPWLGLIGATPQENDAVFRRGGLTTQQQEVTSVTI